uniref:Uncharacterized protein n=1 Tax=Anguilla anguilla TaxID=7936 RepID=A0A0E9T0D7_ANGAN
MFLHRTFFHNSSHVKIYLNESSCLLKSKCGGS